MSYVSAGTFPAALSVNILREVIVALKGTGVSYVRLCDRLCMAEDEQKLKEQNKAVALTDDISRLLPGAI